LSEEAKKHYGSYDRHEILPNGVSIDKRHAIVYTRQHLDDMVSILPDMLYAKRGWVAGYKFAQENRFSPRVVVMDWVEAGLI
jgi:hypothetical protein